MSDSTTISKRSGGSGGGSGGGGGGGGGGNGVDGDGVGGRAAKLRPRFNAFGEENR